TSLLPLTRYAGSWSWPCLGIAALIATHVTIAQPGGKPCPDRSTGPPSGALVCLGDGTMLDPATSLVWRATARRASCADIDPLAEWREATREEVAGLPGYDFWTDGTSQLCVNETLARIRNAGST